MSIQVQHFDDTGAEKALKECPKLVRDYVKKLKESSKHWQQLCGMAINKLKKASKNNCDLPVSISLPSDEEIREPIQNALYSTDRLTTDQCTELADGILTYLNESGFKVVRQ